MTKHPQSKIGYCVNGVVVFKPARSIAQDSKSSKRLSMKRKALRQNKDPTPSLAVRYRKLRFTDEMEDLKNASKCGKCAMVTKIAQNVSTKYFSIRSRRQRFITMGRIFATPDIENRSALYYAAHCGNAELVKSLLAFMVLSRFAARHHKQRGLLDDNQARTMQAWFDRLGYVQLLGRAEFGTCVLNALNEPIRKIFRTLKFTIHQLKQVLEDTDLERHVALEAPREATHNKKPVLSHDWKLKDVIYDIEEGDDDDDESEDDNEYVEEAKDGGDECWEIGPEHYHLLAALDTNQNDNATEIVQDEDSLTTVTVSCREHDGLDEDVHLDNEQDSEFGSSWVDTSSLGSISFVEAIGNLSMMADNPADANWTVVSEPDVQSIQTWVETLGEEEPAPSVAPVAMSFREALLKKSAGTANKNTVGPSFTNNARRVHPSASKQHRPISHVVIDSDDDEDSWFDFDFERDGVKGSRGGKVQLRFKGNTRTPKSGPRYRQPIRVNKLAY